MGHGVKSLAVGDKVAVDPEANCNTCQFCRRGKPNYCETGGHRSTVGFYRDGGWAQYCEIPKEQVHKVPDGMSAKLAVLCEPVSCILHGFKKLGE